MIVQIQDFNGSQAIYGSGGKYQTIWDEVHSTLSAMPVYFKASDQDGKQGDPIFDPVGTNEHLARELPPFGWSPKVPIPADFAFLGTDVDFAKSGVVIEVQFSNYPFLLNNILRSELFQKGNLRLADDLEKVETIILITKSGMFPASNSTLYYEQAVFQMQALAKYHIFSLPIRLVGLFCPMGKITGRWSKYSSARYSREVGERTDVELMVHPPAKSGKASRSGRCSVELIE